MNANFKKNGGGEYAPEDFLNNREAIARRKTSKVKSIREQIDMLDFERQLLMTPEDVPAWAKPEFHRVNNG